MSHWKRARGEPRPVRGRVVAITGAARGIGRATAEALARAGARVAIGDLDGRDADSAAGAIGGGAVGLPLDVSDPTSFARFLDAAEERLGAVEVLVNNAGIMVVGPFVDEDDAATQREFAVNVLGVVYGMRLAIPRMERRGGGQIVNVASLASYVAIPGEATYTATKHAVRGLSDALRSELRGKPIQITVVCPGLVDTELAAGTRPGRGAKLIAPDEVGQAIVEALRRPRPELLVPAGTGQIARLQSALPPLGRQLLGRLFGLDKVTATVDPRRRADYERRVTAAVARPAEARGGGTGGAAAAVDEPPGAGPAPSAEAP